MAAESWGAPLKRLQETPQFSTELDPGVVKYWLTKALGSNLPFFNNILTQPEIWTMQGLITEPAEVENAQMAFVYASLGIEDGHSLDGQGLVMSPKRMIACTRLMSVFGPALVYANRVDFRLGNHLVLQPLADNSLTHLILTPGSHQFSLNTISNPNCDSGFSYLARQFAKKLELSVQTMATLV